MSCIRAIGRVVSEFARLILFIASIVFLLSSLLLLAFTYQSRRDFSYAEVEKINTGLSYLGGLSVYLIVLSVLGIFGSFFSSKSTIKILGLMMALNVIVGLTVLLMSASKLESAQGDLEAKLKDYQAKYDWDHKRDVSEDVRAATQAWDNFQTDSHCCGLASPNDWATFRPKSLNNNLLPLSCCQTKEVAGQDGASLYCDSKTEKFWTDGCSDDMKGAFVLIIGLVAAMICMSFVLAVLTTIVLCCRPSNMEDDY